MREKTCAASAVSQLAGSRSTGLGPRRLDTERLDAIRITQHCDSAPHNEPELSLKAGVR